MSVPYYGDFAAGATVYIPFNTFDSNDPSASVTMTDFANTDVHIHKNLGLTQRNNAAGITVDVDVDAIAGCHGITIDTADNTVADFWVSGADYQVRIEGVTVDAATLNPFVGAFSLENRMVAGYLVSTTIASLASQTSFTLTAGSADDNAYNNCTAIVTDQSTAVQKCIGRISDYTGATKTVALAADPAIFTMAAKDNITIIAASALSNVSSVTGTAQTANDNGADINEILIDTAEIGAAGVGLTDVNTKTITAGAVANASFNADVGSTAHGTNIIALACRKILEELNLDHLLKVDTTVAADGDLEDYCVAGTVMGHLLSTSADATLYKASTDSMQAIRDHIGDGTNLTEVTVAALDANVITAASIDGDAITEAKIADNALANEHFAAGALTATEITGAAGCAVSSIGNDVITPASVDEDADFVIQALSVTNQLDAGTVIVDDTLDVVGAVTCASVGVDANAVVTGTTTLTGNVALGGTLGVAGATTLASASVTGQADAGTVIVDDTLDVVGAVTAASVGIDANATIGGNALVTGTTTHTGAVTHTAGLTSDITGTIDTVTTATTATNLTNAPTNGDLTATMKTSVNTEADNAIISYNLDHLCKTTTGVAADGNLENHVEDGTILSHIMTAGADTSDYAASTDALDANAAAIATAQTDLDTLTDPISEHGVGIPAKEPTLLAAVMWLYMDWRNLTTTDATEHRVTNDAGTVLAEAVLSDAAGQFSKSEWGAVD